MWQLKTSGGLFGKTRTLFMEAAQMLPPGAEVAMDYGPLKTEGQVLIDHGVVDSESNEVCVRARVCVCVCGGGVWGGVSVTP